MPPYLFEFVVLGIVLHAIAQIILHRRRTPLTGPITNCFNCWYTLDGLPRAGKCPECGRDYDLDHEPQRPRGTIVFWRFRTLSPSHARLFRAIIAIGAAIAVIYTVVLVLSLPSLLRTPNVWKTLPTAVLYASIPFGYVGGLSQLAHRRTAPREFNLLIGIPLLAAALMYTVAIVARAAGLLDLALYIGLPWPTFAMLGYLSLPLTLALIPRQAPAPQ